MKVYRHEQSDKEKAASKKGRASRRKGHDFERSIVNALKESLPDNVEVRRMLQSRGGGGLPDVEISVNGNPIFHIECKKGQATNIKKAVEQAINDCSGGAWPVAFTKDDNKDTLVTMLFVDWVGIIFDWLEGMGNDSR